MKVLILLIFISAILVLGAILLFGLSVKNRDFQHSDEASLLPLEEDAEQTDHV